MDNETEIQHLRWALRKQEQENQELKEEIEKLQSLLFGLAIIAPFAAMIPSIQEALSIAIDPTNDEHCH